jgi:hypothetical protein
MHKDTRTKTHAQRHTHTKTHAQRHTRKEKMSEKFFLYLGLTCLVGAGASISFRNIESNDNTDKITYEYITELLTSEDFGKLNELIAKNPTIFDTVRRADGMTLLFWTVVEKRPFDTFLFVLKNTSLDTVNKPFFGSTLLGDMCTIYSKRNGSQIVKALLDKGADRTFRDKYRNNMTPFELAASNDLHEICAIFDPRWGGGRRERTHQLDSM